MGSPYIKLKLELDKLDIIKISRKDKNFTLNTLNICRNVNVKSFVFSDLQIILIGNPIIQDEIKFFELIQKRLKKNNNFKKDAATIDGQFLILINCFKQKNFFVINDRFSSIPLYLYKNDTNIYFSHLYHDLNLLNEIKKLKIDNYSFLQVLFFNRMFGDYTFHKRIRYISSATINMFFKKKHIQTKYWYPNFSKKINKFNKKVGELYKVLLISSVNKNLKGFKNKEVGIFLSGGHDSRSVLLAANKFTPNTISISFSKNYEIEIAKKISSHLSLKNIFIKLKSNHFEKNIKSISRMNSGFYSFVDGLFIGIEKQIPKKIKVLIHGHALDYMFQGRYIPYEWFKIFKRPTFFKTLKNLNKKDLTNFFIRNISYRVKGVNVIDLIKPEYKKNVNEYIYQIINNIYLDSGHVTKNNFDRWEMIVTNNLGRHYSYPNVLGKSSLREQRVVAFDNDLFDFYLSLNPKIKVEAICMRYLMNSLDKDVGKIETSNWGFSASDGPLIKTIKLISRKILRHVTGNSNLKAPTSKDRTFDKRGEYLRNSVFFKKLISEMLLSKQFKKLLFYFDWKKINDLSDRVLNDKNNKEDSFLTMLLTIYIFLKKIKKLY